MPIVNEGVLQEMKHVANPSELKHIEEIYENNIIYLYISPFIEIYKIIINFLQHRTRDIIVL